MNYRERVLLAKEESTYGTDSTPAGTDAVLTSGLTITPYGGPTVSRDLNRSYVGADELINTAPMVQVSFSVELAGSGAAGTAPAWGDLLEACALGETVNAGVDVEYQVIAPDTAKSCTLKFYNKGQEHIVLGARGECALELARGALPRMNFTFYGLYTRPTSASLPTANFSDYVAPVAVTNDNTPTFDIQGTSVVAESLTAALGNNVVHRNVIGADRVLITDRNVTGSMGVEAPDISSKNWFTAVESHNGVTTGAVQLVHGTTAGNIITIDGPAVQLSNIQEQESDGLTLYNMSAVWIPSSGNDEFKLTVS